MPYLEAPLTKSPGKLTIEYGNPVHGITHRVGVRYIVGGMPADADAALVDAAAFMGALQPLFLDTTIFYKWRLYQESGFEVLSGPFLESPQGTATVVEGSAEDISPSIGFGGRGVPGDFVTAAGLARVELFTEGAWAILPGVVSAPLALHPEWEAFAAFLTGSAKMWADVWGQKADSNGYVTLQYNARWQRKRGA